MNVYSLTQIITSSSVGLLFFQLLAMAVLTFVSSIFFRITFFVDYSKSKGNFKFLKIRKHSPKSQSFYNVFLKKRRLQMECVWKPMFVCFFSPGGH